MTDPIAPPTAVLDDAVLIARVTALAGRERELRADFIVELAEFDRRRLYAPAGFSSLFTWLTGKLRLSNASAFRRVIAARMYAAMPEIAAFLRDGRISLTKLCHLKDVHVPDNCVAVLERAAELGEKEVEALAVALAARPAPASPRDPIRPVAPAVARPSEPPGGDLFAPRTSATEVRAAQRPVATREPPPMRHEIRMTVGAEFMALLDELRAELSHSHPAASLETLFCECMKAALAARRKRSRAETNRPRVAPTDIGELQTSRYVPAAVRRAVWERDGGRCTFVAADGRRCGATHRVELHHLVPFALGGPATAANLRLRCRAHNDLAARQDFGPEQMDRFTRGFQTRRST